MPSSSFKKRFQRMVYEILLSKEEKEEDSDESSLLLLPHVEDNNDNDTDTNVIIVIKFIRGFIRTLIILNVISCIVETERELYEAHTEFFDLFHFVSIIIFTIEYILRVWSTTTTATMVMPSRNNPAVRMIIRKAMLRPLNILDLLAILPYYYHYLGDNDNDDSAGRRRIDLRFLRIARIVSQLLESSSNDNKFRNAFMALKEVIVMQKQQLQICILYILFINVLLRSTVMYIFTNNNSEQRKTPPRSFLTENNQGKEEEVTFFGGNYYDDSTPETILEKFFAIITGLFGICILAFPVGIIAAGFRDYNAAAEEKTRKLKQQQGEVLLRNLKLAVGEEVPSLQIDDDGNSRKRRTKQEREEHLQRLKMAHDVVEQAIHLAEEEEEENKKKKKMF